MVTIAAGRRSDIRRSFAVALASGDMYLPAYFGLLDELSGWVRCFWVVGLLLNPVGRAFPVDVTGGGQGRAL